MRTCLCSALVLLVSGLATVTAQDTSSVTTLSPGTAVRYRLIGDTTWSTGRVVGVDKCVGITEGMDTPASRDGGFLVISMSSVEQVEFRRGSSDSTWLPLPASALVRLRECMPGSD